MKSNAVLHITFTGPDDAEESLAAIRSTEEPDVNPPDIDERYVRIILRNVVREQAAIETQNFTFVNQNSPTFLQFERLKGLNYATLIFEAAETISARHLSFTPVAVFGNGLESYPLTRLDRAFLEAALAEHRGIPDSFKSAELLERIRNGIPFVYTPRRQHSRITCLNYRQQIEQQRVVRKRRAPVIEIDTIDPDIVEAPATNKRRIEPVGEEEIPGLSL